MYSMATEICHYKMEITTKANSRMEDSMDKDSINGLMHHVFTIKVNSNKGNCMEQEFYKI